MWLFNARIDHFYKYIGVFTELDHEFLHFLHLSETILVNYVSIVEKQVIFRSQFNLHILDVLVVISLYDQLAFYIGDTYKY
jgi:hypothetical protein